MVRGAKPMLQLCLGQQIQPAGRFAEEHYASAGQKVKSRVEGALLTVRTLCQSTYLAELAGK